MTSNLIQLAIAVGATLLIFRVLIPRWPVATTAALGIMTVYASVQDVLAREWGEVPVDVLALVVWGFLLRSNWRKRKRRKAAQKLGYKARALRARLVRTMRGLHQPGQRVLRPNRVPA